MRKIVVFVVGLAPAMVRAQAAVPRDTIVNVNVSRSARVNIDKPLSYGVNLAASNTYPPPQGPLYSARAAVRLTTSRMTDMSAIQLACLMAGAVTTGGYSYEAVSSDSTWRAKLAEAVQASRETADAAGKAQGFQLGSLISLSINGGPQNGGLQSSPQLSFDARNTNPYITSPEIVVTASASAQYRMIKK